MTTDRHEQILARLDRIIEILEDIRDARRANNDPSRAQQASDLHQRHEKRFISKPELRKRITEMTGLPFPKDE